MNDSFGGVALTPDNAKSILGLSFPVELTAGPDGNGYYAWTRQIPMPPGPGGWTDDDGGMFGTQLINPAFEANDTAMAVGSIVRIRRAYYDPTYDWVYVFEAGGGSSSLVGGNTFTFEWDTGTSDANPGTGKIRADTGTPSAVTRFYVNYTDYLGTDVTTWLSGLYAVPIKIFKVSDPSVWTQGTITGTTGGIGYRKLSFTYSSSATGFAGGDIVALTIGGQTGSPGSMGGDSFAFLWNTSTTDADPGSGKIGANNATPASVTQLFISDDGSGGYTLSTGIGGGFTPSTPVDIAAWLTSLAVGTTVKMFKASDPTKWAVLRTTANDALTDYHRITVTPIASNSTFASNDLVVLTRGAGGNSAPYYQVVATVHETGNDADGGTVYSVTADGYFRIGYALGLNIDGTVNEDINARITYQDGAESYDKDGDPIKDDGSTGHQTSSWQDEGFCGGPFFAANGTTVDWSVIMGAPTDGEWSLLVVLEKLVE